MSRPMIWDSRNVLPRISPYSGNVLQVTQHMCREQAHAPVVDFALASKVNQRLEEGLQGPAPSILSLSL